MNRPSIGVAATFRDECNALPGFLESASRFFDAIFLADCSMDMTPSTDGSLDIIRKWGLPAPPLWNLSEGFGAVRSQLVHSCPTDWVVIMDIDERMHVTNQLLRCEGTDRFPAVAKPDLKVLVAGPAYDHKTLLIDKIAEAESRGIKTVRFSRRHWFDASYTRPCENWNTIRDYQLRCIKARSGVGYTTLPRMHEKCYDFDLNKEPDYIEDDPMRGPYLEHLHLLYKAMEPEQREADIAAYDALDYSDKHTPIPT